ncbi:hypothetical protein RHSIM_Rhsim01G0000900 [Rhododendron simsii]|uniref:Transmembrane protein n=1 Tax=Rhododendron simsii TaxID=118357 RepID=A0A834HKC8_RHOSS|nr:hypothetical protein RHSIM_Rhsim01G0000900 [Rhododendron simsii]
MVRLDEGVEMGLGKGGAVGGGNCGSCLGEGVLVVIRRVKKKSVGNPGMVVVVAVMGICGFWRRWRGWRTIFLSRAK